MVDSDDGMNDEELEELDNDSDEYDEPQDAEYIIGIEPEPVNRTKSDDDHYVYEVLTAGEVVGLIQEIIRDVNTVVQVTCDVVSFTFILFFLLCAHRCDCCVMPAIIVCINNGYIFNLLSKCCRFSPHIYARVIYYVCTLCL